MVDEKGWPRRKATWTFGAIIFLLGVPSALAFGPWSDIKIGSWNFFDFFDYVSFKYMLPIGGFLSILFVLGRWRIAGFLAELRQGSRTWLPGPGLLVASLVLAAVAVLVTFIAGLFGKA
jgi:NSS family neurotransmitter:Na+ symporter